MITVQSLEKSFGSLKAVDSVSFSLSPGETFGLLGPNGAGKSTTISMIVGILKPDHGQIRLTNNLTANSPLARAQIGIAPQSLSLYEDLTATENLTFFGKLYGLKGAHLRSRIEICLDFAGLADRKQDRVSTYSGGMKRRLNMAVAIIHEPELVVFDEPTVGVDPQSRNHIFDCIERLKQEGRTILYTTHYMEEAQRLCDRVAIMDKGAILDVDTVDALLQRHGGTSLLEVQVDDADLPRIAELGTVKNGVLSVRSEDPLALVLRMHERGVAFRSLSIRRPDLEAVFLNLTGRRLRDE